MIVPSYPASTRLPTGSGEPGMGCGGCSVLLPAERLGSPIYLVLSSLHFLKLGSSAFLLPRFGQTSQNDLAWVLLTASLHLLLNPHPSPMGQTSPFLNPCPFWGLVTLHLSRSPVLLLWLLPDCPAPPPTEPAVLPPALSCREKLRCQVNPKPRHSALSFVSWDPHWDLRS